MQTVKVKNYEVELKALTSEQAEEHIDFLIKYEDLTLEKNYRKIKNELVKTDEELYNQMNQEDVKKMVITIYWSNSWNTSADIQVWFKNGTYTTDTGFKTSGGGYCKASTTLSKIFNDYLRNKGYLKLDDVKNNKSPYGINYNGINLYYSYGIGVSSYHTITEYLGGNWDYTLSGKNFDVYTITF